MAISIQNRKNKPRIATAKAKKIAQTICAALDSTDSDLSVVLADDATIHTLNLKWRGKDKETDVLSFSQQEGDIFPAPSQAPMLGDVVISMDTAQRQAQKIGHSLEDEVARLLVHGVLHLLGHDHVQGGAQSRKMKAEEARILEILKHSAV